MYKRTMLASLALAPLLLLSGQALADNTNTDTGANSNNTASTTIQNTLRIENMNSLSLDNDVSLGQTTGDNRAEMNTGSGSIDTGSTNASIMITNEGNTISINGSTGSDTESTNNGTTTTTTNSSNGTVTVSSNGGSQEIHAKLGPNGTLNFDSSTDGNTSEAMVLSANTGNLTNSSGDANDPFSATKSDSALSFFAKYILPLLIIALVLTAVVRSYVRRNTNFQT